jgi:peptidoglycan/xylan/chitin deacetylase (PgdA/CDA1 family)
MTAAVDASPWRRRLSILMYHRIPAQPDPLFPGEVDAARFVEHLRFLKQAFNIIPLREAVGMLAQGRLPVRAACLTFDDGYADNAEVALPIMQEHGVSATVFVATGFLDGGRMWNDSVIELVRRAPAALDLTALGLGQFKLDSHGARAVAIGALLDALKYLPIAERQAKVDAMVAHTGVNLPTNLMMRSEQVAQLHRSGIEIGGHTVHHPIVARMDPAGARREIVEGKAALETIIGAPVHTFAYPNGRPGRDYLAEHVTMVKELGFEAAVTTSPGAARAGDNLYQLPRFTPWDRGQTGFTARMFRNMAVRGATV